MELNSVYIISFFIMTALVPALNSLCQPMSSNSILRPEEVIELSMLCKGVIFTQTKFGLSHRCLALQLSCYNPVLSQRELLLKLLLLKCRLSDLNSDVLLIAKS